MGCFFRKFSNDTQENSKDALKKEEELKKVQEENAKLNRDKNDLARERDKLADQNKTLIETNQKLTAEKRELNNKITGLATDKENLTKDKENLTKDKAELQKQVKDLQDSKQVLENEKTELSKDKENLTKEKAELEQKHAPYQKLEKLYEVFLEVKDRLNFNFVATTHSAMDLIASVLSDSKYYLESLYNKASQELSDKRSDKGEKLAELFDLLFEYIKDSKFERLKEPSAYDYSCKTLYPEQNYSQKIRRVVLRGYTYDQKITGYTIVDMGS
ncbi:hypothetical protein [Helicobacter pylori]|uniref:hypothetical protein n=1 Tax=Helicobacter pylori TaxID=210 RepID=UPI000EAEAAEB|nr:hypothetical protein [Helicobacter pylori]RKV58131.1 hypothetical protein DD777_07935 [Helicobacter pylori]